MGYFEYSLGCQKTGSGPGELRRKFKEFDRDQSGSIDMSEFAKVLGSTLWYSTVLNGTLSTMTAL
jgi:Ca2+-binding EF-hand superfamily protein